MSSEMIEVELRSIEHALHAALVRQLRVISLMALLLGIGGFFVGHFVADAQAESSVIPLRAQIADLQRQLASVTGRCSKQETLQRQTLTALNELEEQRRLEAEHDAAALHALLEDIDRRRTASLQELEAYFARRAFVPPQVVAAAINRFADEQVLLIDRVLSRSERRPDDKAMAATRPPTPAPRAVPAALTPEPAASSKRGIEPPPTTVAATSTYFDPPARRGFLFFTPSSPGSPNPVRVSGSDAIPLPPR